MNFLAQIELYSGVMFLLSSFTFVCTDLYQDMSDERGLPLIILSTVFYPITILLLIVKGYLQLLCIVRKWVKIKKTDWSNYAVKLWTEFKLKLLCYRNKKLSKKDRKTRPFWF